jgi:purine nucleosidase
MPGVPLVLDVDTGVDDALAILYAAGSPDVDLLACTCVMGNVTVEQSVENTRAVLELAGLSGVEVAQGAGRPRTRDHEPFPVVHGERGLGRATPPPPSGAVSERSAVRLIVDLARDRPGEVLLVATANIWVDPEAADAVFRAFSGLAEDRLPVCVGLDVTEQVRMTREHLGDVCASAPESPLARFLQDAVPYYIEFYEQTGDFGGASMHDPLALAIALDPSLARLETTRVEVETEGRWTAGMTVADLHGIRTQPWTGGWQPEDNARVALDVDAAAFMERFLERLGNLVSAQAEAGA